MTRLLQILPRTSGPVCGVSDYGRLLAQELRDGHEIHSSFLAVGSGDRLRNRTAQFPVFDLPHAAADALVSFLASTQDQFHAVLLHMSAYGYQKRGVPLWLAVAWRRLFADRKRPALLTMFHELAAWGPPTSSAFWLRPLQQHVLRTVALCSDGVRTNRAAYADWLGQTCGPGRQAIPAMPVFSNMGEAAASVIGASERFHQMTVFASTIGPASGPLLAEICRAKKITRVGWIGAGEAPSLGVGVQTHRLSHLPAGETGAWFQEHGVAFTAYNPDFLAKSGIFAAFAAHGVAVFLPTSQAELPDQLRAGEHFIPAMAESLVPAAPWEQQAERAASGLRQWYRTHDLKATAASYAAQITGKLAGPSS